MKAKEHLEGLLRRLGESLEQTLVLDEDGACVFGVADDRDFLIALREGADAATFCVNVATVVMDEPKPLLSYLLILNFTDEVTEGATLGLTPDGDDIVVRYTKDAWSLDINDLESLVANLTDLASKLSPMLTQWQRDQQVAASDADLDEDETAGTHFPNYV